nr:xylulose kinase-1 [Tanacetum cinerariifolium]
MMLTFADTHNMVAYLNKSNASEGFNQIINFLNGSYIAYALTVNPTIYVSCIKQFWNTVTIKQSNDVTRLQALVDKKKVVVTEAAIRDALNLDDAEDIDCLPNEEIFTALARMGYEKPSTKLTFYKAFFSSQWKEPEEQGDAKERGNDDNAAEEPVTAVDDGRMIDELDKDEGAKLMNEKEEKETEEVQNITGNAQVEGRQAEIYQIDMDHAAKVLISAAVVVPAAVTETVSAAAVVPTAAPVKVAVPSTRQRRGVVIRDPEEESFAKTPTETKSKDKGKSKEQMEEEVIRAIASINETPAQKAAKRRRLNEEVEDVEELKQHMEIVPDEDDDVYKEATPVARKVPVVDYQIVHFNNKPHYKIIRADETYQLYVSFITLLKNFDREDLESLWSIVKERFSTSKPNNLSDDFLLTTLKAMFGRPDGQDQVWMHQRSVHGQAKVKSWKLLESCGVHIIALTTTQLIMLVERRYPLSRFTLDQMLNTVWLRVEEQSEMSLELIRFIRQQFQEGQHI